MAGELNRLSEIKDIINKVSPSFCLAKWSQVTLHLHNGRTHSCHHPAPHIVPLDELADDPSALHNTKYKKEQMKKMVNGDRPSECQYCWNVEDLDGHKDNTFFSDRITKSASPWSQSKMEEIIKDPGANINPTYCEVSFSNLCNFSCSYCSPVYSSKWVEEIEKYGPYPTSNKFNNLEYYKKVDELPIHHKAHNPYVDAFWNWWPDLVKDLQVFRITGGEPLLHKDMFKVLDYLYEHPMPNLEFAVNTNGCVPDTKIDMFIAKLKRLVDNNCIGKTQIYTSVDGHGKQAEYGRHGLDYNKWLTNIDKLMTELPTTRVTIMSTSNILSITSYDKLIEDVIMLKKKHLSDIRNMPLTIDFAILRHPNYQSVAVLTSEYSGYLDDTLLLMKEHQEGTNGNLHYDGFFDFEIARMERLIEYMKESCKDNMIYSTTRNDFYKFITEHDNRRGTNFLETFPELTNFYNACKGI